MTNNSNSTKNKFANLLETWTKIIANIGVILGIMFAFCQLNQSNQLERRHTAIEVVQVTRTKEFLDSYARIIQTTSSKEQSDSVQLSSDLTFVVNTLDHVGELYLNNLADRKIIKSELYNAICVILDILDNMGCKKQIVNNLHSFKDAMSRDF